jgi:lipopolysaccharide biosynthesis glycosyltransferase
LSHLSYENKTKFENTYFAGGIWVMNVKKIREDNLEKKMLEVINDDSIEKKWNDQDIMNISCNNKVKYISLRYISYPYLMDIIAQEGFQSHYTREELLESLYKPKILHFAAWKPWKDSSIKRADIWWDVFTELNLKKTKIFTDKSLLLKQMKLRDQIRLKIYAALSKKLKRKGWV